MFMSIGGTPQLIPNKISIHVEELAVISSAAVLVSAHITGFFITAMAELTIWPIGTALFLKASLEASMLESALVFSKSAVPSLPEFAYFSCFFLFFSMLKWK